MTKLEFADTVDALCKRPAANTLHGTLPEVLAYLDGLAKGNGLQPGSHWRTSGFFNWLSKNLGKDTIRDDELLLRSELRGDPVIYVASWAFPVFDESEVFGTETKHDTQWGRHQSTGNLSCWLCAYHGI